MGIVIGIAVVLLIVACIRGFARGYSGRNNQAYRVTTVLEWLIKRVVGIVVFVIIAMVILSMFG